ncbi:MAG: hypothetical protein ABI211_30370 [Vicinamibacterales bacterium]
MSALVFVVTSLLASHAEPATIVLAADLDRDGVHDRVSVEEQSPTRVHVWLSTLGVTKVLTNRRPVLAIAAVDLDGDQRVELLVSDRHTLHVWTTLGTHPHRVRRGHSRSSASLFETGRWVRSGRETPAPAQDDGVALSLTLGPRGPGAALLRGRRLSSSTRRLHPAALITPAAPRPPPSPLS